MTIKLLPHWMIEFVLLAAIWGSSFLFMQLGALDFGPVTTAFLRVAIASVVMVPWMLSKGLWSVFRANWLRVMVVGMLNSAIPFVCFAYAVMHINTGMAAVLNATAPLFGALVAWVWLKDRPNLSRSLGMVLGFVGVALLTVDKADFKPGGTGWAVVACLVATLFYGLAASYAKRFLQGVAAPVAATGSQLGAMVTLALPGLWFWPAQMPGVQAWVALGALALLCTAVAYVIYFRLIAAAGPGRALAVTFLIPVFGLGYGAAFLNESVSIWMLGCGVVIVVGTALASGAVALPQKRSGQSIN